MDNIVIAKPIAEKGDVGSMLHSSFKYWFKKFFLFNLWVGIFGLAMTILLGTPLRTFDYFGILMWGMVANLFYSQGYIIDSIVIVRSQGAKSLETARSLLFYLGTTAYVLFTIFYAFMYWILPWAQR